MFRKCALSLTKLGDAICHSVILGSSGDAHSQIELALSQTGYGKFHTRLFILTFGAYMAMASEVITISLIVPAARCDWSMTSKDVGVLTAVPFLGMIVGCFFWGIIADVTGRKTSLACSLLFLGLCGFLSSIAQYFTLFVTLRFFSGIGLIGILSICRPYLGEFHSIKYRKKVFCWMELGWASGVIIMPLLAWLIIPLDVGIKSNHFLLHSWNILLMVSATPSIALGLWAFTFPESPKYYFKIGELEKALAVLRLMFHLNTGNPAEKFPVETLGTIEMDERMDPEINCKVTKLKKQSLKKLLAKMGRTSTILLQPPNRGKFLLSCFCSFCLTLSYYVLMMWFPELFSRFQYYSYIYPEKSASVCEVSSVYIETSDSCQFKKDSEAYMLTIIVGIACTPTTIWLIACVNKIGFKFYLVLGIFSAGFVTVDKHFVTSLNQYLILSCIYEAMTALAVGALYCTVVEIFPTEIRAMAVGVVTGMGKFGAFLGLIAFGRLIDIHCFVAITSCAAILFGAGAASIFLPVK